MAESSDFDKCCVCNNVNIARNYAWSILTVYHGTYYYIPRYLTRNRDTKYLAEPCPGIHTLVVFRVESLTAGLVFKLIIFTQEVSAETTLEHTATWRGYHKQQWESTKRVCREPSFKI